MKRRNEIPYNYSAVPRTLAPRYKPLPPVRCPQVFIDAMKRISESDAAASTPPIPDKVESSNVKWKSSFQPAVKKDRNSSEKDTSSSERIDLYDPSNPLSSDSEPEVSPAQECKRSPTMMDKSLEHQHLPTARLHHDSRGWESSYPESGKRLLNEQKFTTRSRPSDNRGLSPGHRLPESHAYNPETESRDHPGYGFKSRPVDQRGCSPERLILSSPTQGFPESYRGRRTNGEERMTLPEYRREVTSTHRSSPPLRLKRDHQQLGYVETELNHERPPPKETRPQGNTVIMDRCPITCDLCEVELANAQELEDHLDCKSHWDTLEHIQLNNNYDDMAIAFLQEVMLYKSHHCSRAIEENALQALQENDHMTKVEMFHCAACKVYVSTSAAEVKTHIMSQDHLSNTKEFEEKQRRSCLSKAETMIKELHPQFQHFLKGGSPF